MPRSKNFDISKGQMPNVIISGKNITITLAEGATTNYKNFVRFIGTKSTYNNEGVFEDAPTFTMPQEGILKVMGEDVLVLFAEELHFSGEASGCFQFSSEEMFNVDLISW